MNIWVQMTNLEYMIGNMINDEDYRLKNNQSSDLNDLYEESLRIIVECLKQPEFSMMDILKKGGKEFVVKAMDLANCAAKIKLTNEGKL